jgi:hypothetical protein
MNADPRCRQPAASPEAGRGSLLPSQSYSLFSAVFKSAAAAMAGMIAHTNILRVRVLPDLRINSVIAVCCVSSLLLLVTGPEFISFQT